MFGEYIRQIRRVERHIPRPGAEAAVVVNRRITHWSIHPQPLPPPIQDQPTPQLQRRKPPLLARIATLKRRDHRLQYPGFDAPMGLPHGFRDESPDRGTRIRMALAVPQARFDP